MSRILSRIVIAVPLLLATLWWAAGPVRLAHAASTHRLVSVTGYKQAGADGALVDLTLDVPPGADAAALAADALAQQGAQPLADSSPTGHFSLTGLRWPQFSDHDQPHAVVPQYYNPAGDPTAGGALAAVQSAEQAWNSVRTTRFALQYAGTTTASANGTLDGINAVGWTSQQLGGGDVLGVTTTWFNRTTGFILDADVQINANFQWFTDPANLTPTSFDLRYVLLHEFGHVAGLDHSGNPAAVMFAFFSAGVVGHGLAQDDIDAISTLYPLQFMELPAFSATYTGSVTVAGATAPVQAFSASYSGSIAFSGGGSATYSGSGTGTFVGNSQVQGSLFALGGVVSCPGNSFSNFHFDTITAANGDSLSVFVFAVACESPPGSQVYQMKGTYSITGGTGQFSGASGHGTVAGQADATAQTFSLSLSGIIVFPTTYTGSGTGTYLGNSQVQGRVAFFAVSCPGNSFDTQHNDTITAANGDSLFVVVHAGACETPPGSLVYQIEGTYVITGGTGRFVGAVGHGTVVGQADFNTHTFSLTFSGTGS